MIETPASVRRFLILALATVLIPSLAHAQRPPRSTTLDALRNTYRPLLVFAAKSKSPQLLIELRNFRDASRPLAERNVLVIAVPYNSPAPTTVALTPDEAHSARRRFHVAPTDFTVILLGKDGGEKLRTHKPLTIEQLDRIIDAMPTRQQEMQPHAH
jgi:hypothetical protein